MCFYSLYPYVNKYSQYPVGHPVIITSDFETSGSPRSEFSPPAACIILSCRTGQTESSSSLFVALALTIKIETSAATRKNRERLWVSGAPLK